MASSRSKPLNRFQLSPEADLPLVEEGRSRWSGCAFQPVLAAEREAGPVGGRATRARWPGPRSRWRSALWIRGERASASLRSACGVDRRRPPGGRPNRPAPGPGPPRRSGARGSASAVARSVCVWIRSSRALPSVTSERSESDRVAEPARSLATETLSCSSARRTLASRTPTSCAALSASKNWLVVVSACWNRASTRDGAGLDLGRPGRARARRRGGSR